MRKYIRYPEAREHLRNLGYDVAESTLRKMVSERRVPFVKVPGSKVVLFSPSALETWLASGFVEIKT